jgi:hypothetical protein
MALYRKKWFCLASVLGLMVFSGLLWFRFYRFPGPVQFGSSGIDPILAGDTGTGSDGDETWKGVFIAGEKAGFAVSRVTRTDTGYLVEDTAKVRFNAMGMIQVMDMTTRTALTNEYTLDAFDMSVRSGLFDFRAVGRVDNAMLTVKASGNRLGDTRFDIPVPGRAWTAAGIFLDLGAASPDTGTRRSYSLFDPLSLQFVPAMVHVRGIETVQVFGTLVQARAVDLSVSHLTQTVWMDAKGRVVLETGMLGMRLEAGTREQAIAGISPVPDRDLTRLAAVIPDQPIENPGDLTSLVLNLSGIDLSAHSFNTPRQTLEGSRLTITRESLSRDRMSVSQARQAQDDQHDQQAPPARPDPARFLSPAPFIQSDHPDIIHLAESLVQGASNDLDKIRRLVTWVYEQIEKLPAPSIPDALSTLAVRKGDCNEHAVLLAALGRAAGIPTRIETGLTYLDGRFLYHAWNAFYIGHWITADAVFNQVPADVTHVGIAGSDTGAGTALAGLIGRLEITIVETVSP